MTAITRPRRHPSAHPLRAVPDRRAVLRATGMLVLAGAALAGGMRPARARIYTGFIDGTAVGGFDAVAYHSDGVALPGDPAITLEHEGATWRFASEANRTAFAADPDRYAPAYGGHCAWAMAQGYLAPGDPQVWRIEGGRLFLNASEGVHRRWLRDVPGFIARADAAWPTLR